MKVTSSLIAIWIFAASTHAHAGLLDDLLRNPTIQALMNRGDLTTLVSSCQNANYRRNNQTQCVNAENALVISKLPSEMRAVMGNQQSANSLRELCSQAQSTAVANSYLCAELRRAETAIGINSTILQPRPQDTSGRDNDRG